jgi:hypothetical protein
LNVYYLSLRSIEIIYWNSSLATKGDGVINESTLHAEAYIGTTCIPVLWKKIFWRMFIYTHFHVKLWTFLSFHIIFTISQVFPPRNSSLFQVSLPKDASTKLGWNWFSDFEEDVEIVKSPTAVDKHWSKNLLLIKLISIGVQGNKWSAYKCGRIKFKTHI